VKGVVTWPALDQILLHTPNVPCVGTNEDRTSVRERNTTAVPTVPRKDTRTLSKDTVGGGSRDRRAACSPVPALPNTYASAVRGK
jgi:hypothetical protein